MKEGLLKMLRKKIDLFSQFKLMGCGMNDYGYTHGCSIWFKIANLNGDEGYEKILVIKMQVI